MRFQQLGILCFLPGIAVEVFVRAELQRIDENRRHHPVDRHARRIDERHVSGVKRTHRRNERDFFTRVSPL